MALGNSYVTSVVTDKRADFGSRYHIYSSKRHTRPLRTSLFGGLGQELLGSVDPNCYPHPDPNNNPNDNPT